MNPEDDLNISHEDLRTILTRPIAFHRLFADIAGSVGGGVFLSQLYYWAERTEDPHGWIYKTAGEWYEETMLSRRELDSIRKVLKDKGVIKEKLAGVPATVHYKIEWNELFYRLKLSAQTHRDQINQSRENQFGGKRQTTLRAETSSENTTETTTTQSASPPWSIDANRASHPKVIVSSLASEENEPQDIVDKLTEEFGLSTKQGSEIEAYPVGYILEKARIVRSKPRKNLAGAFMKALSDDWRVPRSSEPAKREKPRLAVQDLLFEEPSDEQLTKDRAAIAAMKATVKDAVRDA